MLPIGAASEWRVWKWTTVCIACVKSLNIYLVIPKLSGICPLPTLLRILVSQSCELKCTAESNERETCAVTQAD